MSVVCKEVFDETSHPSVEEVKDYAIKLGIDPDSEPHLIPLAAEGLMKALPPGWKPCYDDNSKSYYYYNNLTKKTQWEHPLDDVYRGLVKKARAESQSLSLGEPTEDATYGREEIPSYEEPINPQHFAVKGLEAISLGARKKDLKLSPIKHSTILRSPSGSPKHESRLYKQKSEEYPFADHRPALSTFSSFDDKDKDGKFSRHPRNIDNKTELKVMGGGLNFLKSNTKKQQDVPSPSFSKAEPDNQPKSILRGLEHSKSVDFERLSLLEKSDKEDDDKKSVRFNLESTDGALTFSDKSSSEEDIKSSDNKKPEDVINVKVTPALNKILGSVDTANSNLKLIKPNPSDFIKPKLTISKGSDSEEDSFIKSLDKQGKNNPESFFEGDEFLEGKDQTKQLGMKADKKMSMLKQTIWEEKNDELVKFRSSLKESHKEELERILINEKTNHENNIKAELENLRKEMESRTVGTLKSERIKLDNELNNLKLSLEKEIKAEEEHLKSHFSSKKEELERYYEEKLAEVEKELAERVETNRDELIMTHNATIEQLKQNHSIIIEELKREFQVEEQNLRKEHQSQMAEIRSRMQDQDPKLKQDVDERTFEKMRCDKRLLEDKYRCMKEKYLRLKTEVKMSIEKRHRKKDSTTTTANTNTTGSETEQSHSNNKERTPLNSPSKKVTEKPPTPKSVNVKEQQRKVVIQDVDTSISDNYQNEDHANRNDNPVDYESSDTSLKNAGRRKKLFPKPKTFSAARGGTSKTKLKPTTRPCSPVENLRRQLQKLEDLEDQFPQNAQGDTYHLRYPFSDGQKFEGSSELEFFRHRIHLERDSIKRAKESLRNQKSVFQQRQKDLKLKHGSMARHTLQQLCQEEKELTDMEVSLHRTRSLLGEKVIRLRHLEQSLQRANLSNEQKIEDATLSDISSHSASSGISSTEFATAPDANFGKSLMKVEQYQESSEIIQSLENLNSEIREIWDVLRTQQQQSNIATVIPPFVYPDLGWPVLAGAAAAAANSVPAPPSIPTLADRLHNYRQQVALANAQSTMVTHHATNQQATTTLVERTRNLRHWLRQTGADLGGNDGNAPQATL